MKIITKTILIILYSIIVAYSQVPIPKSGIINGETWITGNTYLIVGNITVQNLTIQPGVVVEFFGQYNFGVEGELTASASITDSIIFRPSDTNSNGWNGILINGGATKAHFSFCLIEDANNQSIYVAESDIFELNNSVIKNTDGNGVFIFSGGAVIKARIKNSRIENNSQNGIYLVKGDIEIYNSIIAKNGLAGIVTTQNQDKLNIFNCIITNNSGTGIISSSANGPINVINSIVYHNNSSLDLTTSNIDITYSDIEGETVYPGEGNVLFDPSFADTISYELSESSFCKDLGNPNVEYNDVFFPPSLGSVRNDMGAYGGPHAGNWYENLTIDSHILDFGSVSISSDSIKVLKLKNFTNSAVNVSDVSISGDDIEFFSISDTNFTIASMDSYSTEIVFSPNIKRTFTADVTVECDLGSIKYNLLGEGLVPVIDISATFLNFDTVDVQGDSLLHLKIYNTGQSELFVYKDSIAITGSDSSEFFLEPLSGNIVIPAQDSAEVNVTFAPSDSGYKIALLNIYSNDPVNPIRQVELNGTAIKPYIRLSNYQIDFGFLEANKDSLRSVRIYNTGSAELIVYSNSMEIAGLNSTEFSFEKPVDDLFLPVGDSTTINITFAPVDSGLKEAVLHIYSNDIENVPVQIDLFGKAFTRPSIMLSDNHLDFGNVAFGEDSVKQLTIYNTGSAELVLYKDSVNISGLSASHFSMEPWLSNLKISRNDSAVIDLYFSPSDSGFKEATIDIISNDPDSSQKKVSLSGRGFIKPTPSIDVKPIELNFGQIALTQQSLLDLTIYNVGQANLQISGNSLTGTDSLDFFIEEFSGDSLIPFRDSAKITIGFKPSASTDKTAQLNIISNDPVTPVLPVLLTGTGAVIDSVLPVIVLDSEQLIFEDVVVNKEALKEITIFNEGESELTLYYDQLKINGSGSSFFSFENIDININIPKNDSAKISVKFSPLDTLLKTAMLVIHSNDIKHTPKNVLLSGKGIGDPEASITFAPDVSSNTFIKGETGTIAFNISAYSPIDSAFLFFKQSGSSNYVKTNLLNTSDSLWTTDLAGDYFTERGLEYYVESHHRQNITHSQNQAISVLVPSIDFPEPTRLNKYQLISVPLNVNQQSLGDLLVDDLGNYSDKKYRVFDYDNEDSIYIEYRDLDQKLEPGQSLWLITRNQHTINIENGMSVSSIEEFQINLMAGWNMIANPFAFPVAWDDVDPVLEIQTHDGTEWSFSDVMQPYAGCVVYAENDTTISVPPVESITFPKTPGFLATTGWYFQISAEGKQVFDRQNYAGVRINALNTKDKFDYPEAPPIGKYLSVSLKDKITGKKYTADFRKPGMDGYEFNIKVQSNTKSRKTIQFIPYNLPENYDWVVVTPESKMIYGKNTIAVNNNQNLMLLVGTDDYLNKITEDYKSVPAKISLMQNYPNPFNPQTNISFELPSVKNVQVTIFDVLGKQVKTLINNQSMNPGYHTITWDGLNDYNTKVSSGIYFLRFKAGGYSKIIKMIMNN